MEWNDYADKQCLIFFWDESEWKIEENQTNQTIKIIFVIYSMINIEYSAHTWTIFDTLTHFSVRFSISLSNKK